MKKLMIAAAIVCAAAMSQAAAITWSASNIYQPGSTENKIASGHGLVYFFCSQDLGTDKITTALSSTETSLADKAAYLAANDMGTPTALNSNGKISSYATPWDHAAGTYNMYAVIFADDTIKEGGKYVVTALSADTAWDNTSGSTVSLGSQSTLTQNIKNWSSVAAQSVPEPTSGLLLLLGVAGLALKRRRA